MGFSYFSFNIFFKYKESNYKFCVKKLKYKNLEYKEIDEEYIGKTAQIIYNNKVAIFILGTPYYLIIIENKEIANTYKKQFNLLWKIAKK